jgi:hypothetical protein
LHVLRIEIVALQPLLLPAFPHDAVISSRPTHWRSAASLRGDRQLREECAPFDRRDSARSHVREHAIVSLRHPIHAPR